LCPRHIHTDRPRYICGHRPHHTAMWTDHKATVDSRLRPGSIESVLPPGEQICAHIISHEIVRMPTNGLCGYHCLALYKIMALSTKPEVSLHNVLHRRHTATDNMQRKLGG